MLVDEFGIQNKDFQIVKDNFTSLERSNNASAYSLQLEYKDGSGIAKVYSVPVKYVDCNGEFCFIDTSLKAAPSATIEEGYEFCNAANSFTIAFSSAADKGIKVNDDFTIAMATETLSTANSGVTDKLESGAGRISYAEAFGPETTVEYINTETGVKENIILHKNTHRNEFSFTFYSNTHIPVLSADKTTITIVNKSDPNKIDYLFSNIFAYDSYHIGNDTSKNDSNFRHLNDDCYYKLTPTDNGTFNITIVVPPEYLNHPELVYPVTIDPTIIASNAASNIADTYVAQDSPNSNYASYSYLRFGNTNSTNARNYSFIWFRELPYISPSYTIAQATLRLTFRPGQTSSSIGAVYRATEEWAESALTWNNRPTFEDSPLDTSNHNNFSYYEFDIAPIINDRYQGLSANEGALISYQDLTYNDYNSVYSSESATNGPSLTISYYTPEVILDDGIYFFRNEGYYSKTGFYMDLTGDGTSNGTHVQQYQFVGSTPEQWEITYQGRGYYKIRSVHATAFTMLLDGRATCTPGAQVIIYDETPCPEQLWRIELTGDEGIEYRLSPMRNPNLYLSVEDPSSGNHAKVKLETTTQHSQQKWVLEKASAGVGGALGYKATSRTDIKCYQYAMTLNVPNIHIYFETGDSVYRFKDRTLNAVRAQGKHIREISENDLIHPTREYRVALRVANGDYHFLLQLSDGTWAHKLGTTSSAQLGAINPSQLTWYWGNHNYDSPTIYFAVEAEPSNFNWQ